MLRSVLGWGSFALLTYLIFLLLTLPARLVAGWSGMPLTEVRGSLWTGTAALTLPGEQPGKLQWQLRPLWPWQGLLNLELMAEQQGWQGHGSLRLQWDGALRLQDAILHGPLDAPFLSRRLPVALSGQAHLTIPKALWQQQGLRQAEGVILELRQPRLLLRDAVAMGDLAAELEVVDGRLHGRMHDKGGPLQLHGQVQGDAHSGLTLELDLKPRSQAPTALADILRLLPTTAEGGARIHTRLPAPWLMPLP